MLYLSSLCALFLCLVLIALNAAWAFAGPENAQGDDARPEELNVYAPPSPQNMSIDDLVLEVTAMPVKL